jgi:ATP adenylyltransferase
VRAVADERIWAPWRLDFIRGEKPEACIFCRALESDDDAANYVLHRGEHAFVMLNAFPYNSGHLMVAPVAHVPSIEELGDEALLELMTLTQRALAALREVYSPEGFNLGLNQGKVAGAGIEDHMHLHVVPRWAADTNFMPVVGSTRVLPQTLSDSHAELSRAFR